MKERGGLTVLAALVLPLAAAFFLVLLEAARVAAIRQNGQILADSALESVFAGYDTILWEKYHLLMRSVGALDGSVSVRETEQELSQFAEAAANPVSGGASNAVCFLRSGVVDAAVEEYTLVTDEGVFCALAAACRKREMSEAEKQEMDKLYESWEALCGQPCMTEEAAERMEEGELFSLVAAGEGVSMRSISLSGTVSHRDLEQGTAPLCERDAQSGAALVNSYYLSHFSSYLSPKEEGSLQYELEYILCGNQSDKENLEAALFELFLLRLRCNLAFLEGSAEKQEEAGLAAGAGDATAEQASRVLVDWAYAESILDLRALLEGERIALVKSETQWTSEFSEESAAGQRAKNCVDGLDYVQYLGLLLYAKDAESLAYRAMDLQELYARAQPGYEGFCMDHMAVALSATVTYSVLPVFSSSAIEAAASDGWLFLSCRSEYSYVKEGV